MTDNTFCSTDPDKYYEVECPVNYVGVATQLKWYVSSINTIYSIEMFGPDDYIEFVFDWGLTDITTRVGFTKSYRSLEDTEFMKNLNDKLKDIGIVLSTDDLGKYQFTGTEPFKITGMSYNLKQALGFYYLKDVYLESDKSNTIKARSRGYTNLSPIWFLLSNLGSPNIIASSHSPYDRWYPAIAMKIQNSFTMDQPLQYGNGDFMNICQASALGNLKVRLVDCNLEPVKLLYPLYVTVSFAEMDEELAEIDEAMEEVETNQETVALINEYVKKNREKMANGYSEIEKGIAERIAAAAPTTKEGEQHASVELKERAEQKLSENVTTQETIAAQDIHE